MAVRTPLGLVPNADGSYLLLYTGLHKKFRHTNHPEDHSAAFSVFIASVRIVDQ